MPANIRRKNFLLPQSLIRKVKNAYHAKTETEAVVLSLEAALRKKRLEKLAALHGKVKFSLTRKELHLTRGR